MTLDGAGAGASANGLTITGGGSTISGLNIVNFSGAGISLQTGGGNTIQDVRIGTTGGSRPSANTGDGILIDSSNNVIGGLTTATANIITSNGGNGISIVGRIGNHIRINSIYSNGEIEIDLGNDGVTANDTGDADTGANDLQNHPVLVSATSDGSITTIQGTLNSTADSTFRVDFFSNPTCDGSGNGEGKTHIGSANVTTNAGGNAAIDSIFNVAIAESESIASATATSPGNNTSEFSACISVACGYGLATTSQSFASSGGTDSFAVNTQSECEWTAVSNDPWIHITSGAPDPGSGTVDYSVDPSTSPNSRSGTITVVNQTFTVVQGALFADVPESNVFFTLIGKLSARGVTVGCGLDMQGGRLYCPSDSVTREQMAAFIIRSLGEFNPPTPPMQRFADVPPSNPFYPFIERMAVLGITVGCGTNGQGDPIYCPASFVTREQMAAFLIRALGEFNPPVPPTQRFADVPPSNVFYAFIDRMAELGITVGCGMNGQGQLIYCPADFVSRQQMAAFLVRAFDFRAGSER